MSEDDLEPVLLLGGVGLRSSDESGLTLVGSRLRPGRFVIRYSHATARLAHREQVGFSFELC